MLKITEILDNQSTIRLRLDGTVNESSCLDIEDLLRRHRSKEQITIVLDMAGVSFINGEAARKVALLCDHRVQLANCSPYLDALFQLIEQQNGSSSNRTDLDG